MTQQTLSLKEQLKALERIQEVDLKIDSIKKTQGSLPAGIRALDEQLAKLNASVTAKKAAAAEVEKAERQNAGAADLARDRLARSTGRLESVHNTHEYQAASKEIEQLKAHLEQLAEQSKKHAADLDAIHRDLAGLQVSQSKLQAERDEQASGLTHQTGKMEQELAELSAERGKFAPGVDKRVLLQYDRVRAQRGGLGIVPAVAGRCKGCNMMVPPQQFNEIQRGTQMHHCPSCHRLLFVPSSDGAKT